MKLEQFKKFKSYIEDALDGLNNRDIVELGISTKTNIHQLEEGQEGFTIYPHADSEQFYLADFDGFPIDSDSYQEVDNLNLLEKSDSEINEILNCTQYDLFYIIVNGGSSNQIQSESIAWVCYDEPGGTDNGDTFYFDLSDFE